MPVHLADLVSDLAGHGSRDAATLPFGLDPARLANDLIDHCALATRSDSLV